eukprot:scaffold225_cov111-Isochrysis_galbana.AAC.11
MWIFSNFPFQDTDTASSSSRCPRPPAGLRTSEPGAQIIVIDVDVTPCLFGLGPVARAPVGFADQPSACRFCHKYVESSVHLGRCPSLKKIFGTINQASPRILRVMHY